MPDDIVSSPEPAWRAEKAAMDAIDDGHGPYSSWAWAGEEGKQRGVTRWRDFLVWAADNLGQGFSLACCEGSVLDPITDATFHGYMAGIAALEAENEALREDSARLNWLASRLEDVSIDNVHPTMFLPDNADEIDDRDAWCAAWRAAIDAARRKQ